MENKDWRGTIVFTILSLVCLGITLFQVISDIFLFKGMCFSLCIVFAMLAIVCIPEDKNRE